jgi:hypothetical protein
LAQTAATAILNKSVSPLQRMDRSVSGPRETSAKSVRSKPEWESFVSAAATGSVPVLKTTVAARFLPRSVRLVRPVMPKYQYWDEIMTICRAPAFREEDLRVTFESQRLTVVR